MVAEEKVNDWQAVLIAGVVMLLLSIVGELRHPVYDRAFENAIQIFVLLPFNFPAIWLVLKMEEMEITRRLEMEHGNDLSA